MPPVEERVSRLLQLMFEAPGDIEAWWRFFEALAAEISPDVHVVALTERRAPAPTTLLFGARRESMVPGALPRRRDGGPRIEALLPGAVFELPRLPKKMAEHPAVRGLIEPVGLLPGPGVGVVVDGGEGRAAGAILALPHREGWQPAEADRALFAELAPFLLRVTKLHERLLTTGAVTSILDHLVLGVILADHRGRVSYLNRSAAEMLGVEPGLSDPGGGAERDPRSDALYRTVRPTDDAGESQYRHPSDGRPLSVLSAKLEWATWQGYPARRFARALFVGDAKHGSGDPFGNLGRLYRLTQSEAHLAALLVGDFSLLQAAEQLGITESTARTVLKRILAKTGTRRQASLVRLLLSGPAQIRDDAPPRTNRHEPRRRPRR
jgi:DNA-binding CsgD family transcriptional regulator